LEYDDIFVQGDDVEGEEEEDDDEEEADDNELDCGASKSFIRKSLKLENCP
jgi:hypothetical protein